MSDSFELAHRSLQEAAEGYLEALAIEGASLPVELDLEVSVSPIRLNLQI